MSGFWSRRISNEHRLIYTLKNKEIYVLQSRYHY
ncbi:MAG TPA: type II toxin-antitoxin system YoeB family toxin [Candidatus Megaira endosymbiont of Nemacystus decipiens]|nr:type II toxin-antitoxin system YoeB family toxin [Candidatus Megaera endosymbiont of Nemacystus decipiens]